MTKYLAVSARLACIMALAASKVAAGAGDLKHPDWHPDGRVLVSEGSCAGDVGLYLIDTGTGTVTLLFDSKYTDGYPRWFHDGRQIAFHQIDGRRHSRIYIADVSPAGEIGNVRAVTEGPFDIEPAPSPDGTRLAYSAEGSRGQDIALLNLANHDTKVWTTKLAENFPTWHPDGGSIFFHAEEDEQTHIYQRLLSTYQLSQLTRGGSPNLTAHVNADATRLVFASERTGDREIYLMDLQSGSQERLTNRAGSDGYPKFSPDASRIAYHSVIEGGTTVVRIQGLGDGKVREFSCDDWSARLSGTEN